MTDEEITKIGNINHEYGHLVVKRDGDKYFWSIEANTFTKWEEIPESLYKALIEFNNSGKDKDEASHE